MVDIGPVEKTALCWEPHKSRVIRATINSDDKDNPTTWKQSYLPTIVSISYQPLLNSIFVSLPKNALTLYQQRCDKIYDLVSAARLPAPYLPALLCLSDLTLLLSTCRLFTNFMVSPKNSYLCASTIFINVLTSYLPHVLFDCLYERGFFFSLEFWNTLSPNFSLWSPNTPLEC